MGIVEFVRDSFFTRLCVQVFIPLVFFFMLGTHIRLFEQSFPYILHCHFNELGGYLAALANYHMKTDSLFVAAGLVGVRFLFFTS